MAAPHHGHVEQAGAGEVVYEAAGARDEPPVFLAPGRSADQVLGEVTKGVYTPKPNPASGTRGQVLKSNSPRKRGVVFHDRPPVRYESGLVALSENISGSRGNRGPRPQQPGSTGSVKAMTFHMQ